MDLNPNYETNNKDAWTNPVAFPIFQTILIMKLQELTQYP